MDFLYLMMDLRIGGQKKLSKSEKAQLEEKEFFFAYPRY